MEENNSVTVTKKSVWKYATFIIVILFAVGIFMFMRTSGGATGNTITGNTVNNGNSGDVQKVTLSIKNSNYYPNTFTVKANQPVSITLDSSISGCLRSFNIRDLGVQGYSKDPSQTIDFTPKQKGTFRFACSMGMGFGTIIVE